jgi:DNA-binding IclR family transcriptional regulator
MPQAPATFSYEHEGDRQFATTLARGLEVLRCFTPLEPLLGNKEISVRTGLPKPTVSRLTYTLTKLGYLRHNMRLGKYQLGSAVLSIGYPLLASMNVRQVARPLMKELADYCNGSVSMGVRDRLNMVYVESCRSGNGITTLPDIGTSVPISQSVIGRAFLSACTPPERESVLNQMKVKEPEAHRKFRPSIDKALDDIRMRGFCASTGELRREVYAVAPRCAARSTARSCRSTASSRLHGEEGQLEDDLGPRLVMVRNIEASIGFTSSGHRRFPNSEETPTQESFRISARSTRRPRRSSFRAAIAAISCSRLGAGGGVALTRVPPTCRGAPALTRSGASRRSRAGVPRNAAAIVIVVTRRHAGPGELGVSVAPILATAGVAGIAIGFGAQSLIKDYFNGFFLLLDDQIRQGDVVQVADRSGLVEQVTLRYVRLRDLDGHVHFVPNGEIKVVTNRTREYATALVEIGIAYREDPDEAIGVMREVAAACAPIRTGARASPTSQRSWASRNGATRR